MARLLDNVTHRSAGTGGVDTLTNPADRAKVAKFLSRLMQVRPYSRKLAYRDGCVLSRARV
jgi:hypothetical protein